MATMNVSLPDQMRDWVQSQTSDGKYSNASDYVRDLIRRDQERHEAITALQTAITEGVESGPPQAFDPAAFKKRMHKSHSR